MQVQGFDLQNKKREGSGTEENNLKTRQEGFSKGESGEETSENSEDSEKDDREEQIQILGGPSANQQLLLIKGVPGQIYQLNGRVLCSSKSIETGFGDQFLEALSMGLKKIEQRELGYYIVSKQAPQNGKILVLDSQIYGDRFYIDWSYLLLLNLDKSQYKLKNHQHLRHLKMIEAENKEYPQLLVIQGKKGKPFIEKCLAEEQQMYLINAHVVAMSENVFVRKNKKTGQIRLRGPGIVFVQPNSKFRLHPKLQNLLITNFLMILFLLLITAIEVMFF